MIVQKALKRLTQIRERVVQYGQLPATLWDIRLALMVSQIFTVAIGALILWLIL
jgi:hypothetical protein